MATLSLVDTPSVTCTCTSSPGWDAKEAEHAAKLVEREIERLRASFEAARSDGNTCFIMFLHYPPTNILQRRSGFTDMAEEYGVEKVIYAPRFSHQQQPQELFALQRTVLHGDN